MSTVNFSDLLLSGPVIFMFVGILLALLGLLRRIPHLVVVGLFLSGFLLTELGFGVRSFTVVLAGSLFAPLIGYALMRRWGIHWASQLTTLLTFVAGIILLGVARGRTEKPEFLPHPVTLGRWTSSHPLHVLGNGMILKPGRGEARWVDWKGNIHLDWPPQGGDASYEFLVENVGPLDDVDIVDGRGRFLRGFFGKTYFRGEFSRAGSRVRIQARPFPREKSRVLLVGGVRGDLAAVHRLVDAVRDDPPDVIVGLGGLAANGSYASMLGARDLLDGLLARSVHLPGPEERAISGDLSVFEALYGPFLSTVLVSGVAVLRGDSSEGVSSFGGANIGFDVSMARPAGGLIMAQHHPVMAPEGRENELLPDEASRQHVIRKLLDWTPLIFASVTSGEAYDLEKNEVRHIAVGGTPGVLQAAMVEVNKSAVLKVQWITVKRSRGVVDPIVTKFQMLDSLAMERPLFGVLVVQGIGFLCFTLGALLGLVISRKRAQL